MIVADNFRRRAKLRGKSGDTTPDILAGEVVRAAWGGPLGFVESITNGHAVVFWHTSVGYREIVALNLLRRAAANPAFGPDVREI